VKEIDFLPEWYKEGKRRRVYMCRQCVALGIIFLAMVGYNTIAAQKIAHATAGLAQLEDQRIQAENVMHRFDMLSKELGEYQTEVKSLAQMDSRIELAAVLAEISHIIGGRIVLSRVEFISEPVSQTDEAQNRNRSAVRAAGTSRDSTKPGLLGDVRFRILLAGVAASPKDVGELVCRLEESFYFQDVHPSFSRPGKVEVSTARPRLQTNRGTKNPATELKETIPVSDFEITCYLANYEEIESQ